MADEPSKIAIGTAQFGLDYGISNTTGKVPPSEVRQILQWCAKENIHFLDTDAAYGNSEIVLGQNIANSENIHIISKLSSCNASQVKAIFQNSLRHLKRNKIYGYLIHDFAAFSRDPQIFEEIHHLQQEGFIQKIGFSLYFPEQFEELIRLNLPLQLVQIPFNVFDQRFTYLFPLMAARGIEVHIRSVFLQGLIFKNLSDLPSYFTPFRRNLETLQEFAKQHEIALTHLMLAFAHLQFAVSKIVVGVTTLEDLILNNKYVANLYKVKPLFETLQAMAYPDERFILPFNWQLKNE